MLRMMFSAYLLLISFSHVFGEIPPEEIFQSNNETTPLPERRIIGGQFAGVGEFPYIAYITVGSDITERGRCIGSIIHKRWILTVAHCIKGRTGPFKRYVTVVYGTTRREGSDAIFRRVEAVIPHPDYKYVPEEENGGIAISLNDIGLLRLSTDIVFNKKVKPIQLSHAPASSDYGKWGRLPGFGSYSQWLPVGSFELRFIDVQITSYNECKKWYPWMGENNLCSSLSQQKTPCGGDSGAPLVSFGLVVGIVAMAEKGCSVWERLPVYTRVGSYIHWIKKHLLQYHDHI